MQNRRAVLIGSAALALSTVPVVAAVPDEITSFLVPSFLWQSQPYTESVHGNYRTLFWRVMERWTLRNGKLEGIERAHVWSLRYEQWLSEEKEPRKHYPHIQFGGCVVPNPKGDPEFYSRWVEYAATLV